MSKIMIVDTKSKKNRISKVLLTERQAIKNSRNANILMRYGQLNGAIGEIVKVLAGEFDMSISAIRCVLKRSGVIGIRKY